MRLRHPLATLAALVLLLAVGAPAAAGSPTAPRLAPLPTPAATGATWTWPLPGSPAVPRGFDPPAEPWLPGHRGVDLTGRPGQLVRSAGAGVVQFAGRVAGVGVVSVLHGDGLLTTYQPVRPLVRRGQHLYAGAVVGRLAAQGSHCAPAACLHWGLRRGADYLDPLGLVGAARVRLLPLPSGRD